MPLPRSFYGRHVIVQPVGEKFMIHSCAPKDPKDVGGPLAHKVLAIVDSPEDLAQWLRNDFLQREAASEERRLQAEREWRAEHPEVDLDLDIEL